MGHGKRKPKPAPASQAQAAAQDWLPLRDLDGGLLTRSDGAVVGGVRIEPLSLALKSAREVAALVGAVHAAMNGISVPWQMLAVQRPVDLDAELGRLAALQVDARRAQVLRAYRAWVEGLVRGGESMERRFYVLLVRTGADAAAEHRQALPALAADLGRARGLGVRVMANVDWRELMFLAFHAEQAAVEAVPDGLPALPPIYKGGDGRGDGD
jgi:hypothetical protein